MGQRFENMLSSIKSNFLFGIIVVLVYWVVMYMMSILSSGTDSLSYKIMYYGYYPLAWTSHEILHFVDIWGPKMVVLRFCEIACGVSEGSAVLFTYSSYFEVFFISSVIFLLVVSVQKLIHR